MKILFIKKLKTKKGIYDIKKGKLHNRQVFFIHFLY